MDVDDVRAGEVYTAELEPRRRGPLARVGAQALDVLGAALGNALEFTTWGDVVVRHRSDGSEKLRIPVDGTEEAAQMLAVVRDQLERLSPEAFRAHWTMA